MTIEGLSPDRIKDLAIDWKRPLPTRPQLEERFPNPSQLDLFFLGSRNLDASADEGRSESFERLDVIEVALWCPVGYGRESPEEINDVVKRKGFRPLVFREGLALVEKLPHLRNYYTIIVHGSLYEMRLDGGRKSGPMVPCFDSYLPWHGPDRHEERLQARLSPVWYHQRIQGNQRLAFARFR